MHESVGRVQLVVFEKFTSAYLFQIAREKSFEYTRDNFCHASVLYVTNEASSYFNFIGRKFKRKKFYSLSKSCMKIEQFLVKSV